MFKCKNCTNENSTYEECGNARYDDENWCINADLEIVNSYKIVKIKETTDKTICKVISSFDEYNENLFIASLKEYSKEDFFVLLKMIDNTHAECINEIYFGRESEKWIVDVAEQDTRATCSDVFYLIGIEIVNAHGFLSYEENK